MTTVINFNEASIDIELFEAYQKKAMEALEQADTLTKAAKEHKLDFKDYVESIAKATNLPKKDIDAFWKARYEESRPKDENEEKGTKPVINRGELFATLNEALEGGKE